MTSATTDQIGGLTGSVAVKPPCRVATTANITLSGLQAIDGVTVAEGDRVLVKDQSTAANNGIYVASTGTWQRSADFDGNRDVVKGTRVLVSSGSNNLNTNWAVTTADPIVIDTSAIAFTNIVATSTLAPWVLGYASEITADTTLSVTQAGRILPVNPTAGRREITLPLLAGCDPTVPFIIERVGDYGLSVVPPSADFPRNVKIKTQSHDGSFGRQSSFTISQSAADPTTGEIALRLSEEQRVLYHRDAATVLITGAHASANGYQTVSRLRSADVTTLGGSWSFYNNIVLVGTTYSSASTAGTVELIQDFIELNFQNERITIWPDPVRNCFNIDNQSKLWTAGFAVGRNYWYPKMGSKAKSYPNTFYVDALTFSVGLGGNVAMNGYGDPPEFVMSQFRVDPTAAAGQPEGAVASATATPTGTGCGFFGWRPGIVGSGYVQGAGGKSGSMRVILREDAVDGSIGADIVLAATPIGSGTPVDNIFLTESGLLSVGTQRPTSGLIAGQSGSQTLPIGYARSSHATYTGTQNLWSAARAASAAYNFFEAQASGSPVARLTGEGELHLDVGALVTPAAGFAEYLVPLDSVGKGGKDATFCRSVVLVDEANPDFIIPRGVKGKWKSVRLRFADTFPAGTFKDVDDNIVGMVEILPVIVGNSPIFGWGGKYVTDDFGRRITEPKTVWQWQEEVTTFSRQMLDADRREWLDERNREQEAKGKRVHGRETLERSDVFRSELELKPGETVPAQESIVTDWEVKPNRVHPWGLPLKETRIYDLHQVTMDVPVISPDFDPEAVFVPRSKREEWPLILLKGQGLLYEDQPIHPSWRDLGEHKPAKDGRPAMRKYLV